MPKCTDPEAGLFLHAYELGLLSQQEADSFEIHLLGCTHCFDQVAGFERESDLILSDEEIRKTTQALIRAQRPPWRLAAVLRRFLWPKGRLQAAPTLAYLLVIVMLIPSYRGLKGPSEQSASIRPVREVQLLPLRSGSTATFSRSQGQDRVLRFVTRGVTTTGRYRVIVETDKGHQIARYDGFVDTDDDGVGAIYIPVAQMQPGEYRLLITGPETNTASDTQTHWFRIVE